MAHVSHNAAELERRPAIVRDGHAWKPTLFGSSSLRKEARPSPRRPLTRVNRPRRGVGGGGWRRGRGWKRSRFGGSWRTKAGNFRLEVRRLVYENAGSTACSSRFSAAMQRSYYPTIHIAYLLFWQRAARAPTCSRAEPSSNAAPGKRLLAELTDETYSWRAPLAARQARPKARSRPTVWFPPSLAIGCALIVHSSSGVMLARPAKEGGR